MNQIRSILVPKLLAHVPEAAYDLLREKGYDVGDVEDTPEGWLFRQGQPCACPGAVVCDENGCRVTRGPACGCGDKRSKAMDEDERPDEEERPGEGGDEEPADEEMREKVALKAGALWLRGLRAYSKACEETVEHSGVLKLSKRVVKWGHRTAKRYYPKDDLGYQDADESGEDADDEEEQKPSDEEKAIASAFSKVMQELFGDRKNYGRDLRRDNGSR